MADINVKIVDEDPQPDQAGGEDFSTPQEKEKPKQIFTIKLKVRTTLAGDFIVSDHPDIDIVIMPEKKEINCFFKREL